MQCVWIRQRHEKFLKFAYFSITVPIYLKNKFHVPLLSILWHVVAGRDCEEDKHTLYEIFSKSTKYVFLDIDK